VLKITTPLHSLKQSNWFKLICGASYQHIPAIRNLSLVYSLAGADCIDVAADSAVINTALEGIKMADILRDKAIQKGFSPSDQSWLMVSINDGDDPHFRKAQFNPNLCPSDCSRPCVQICPAEAIQFSDLDHGVIDELCYGCGRCFPVCPSNLISSRSSISNPKLVSHWLSEYPINALEIHTQVGHLNLFKQLWQVISPHLAQLQLLAISCPYEDGVIEYLQQLYRYISPLPCALIWQTDGRPMSGDIGKGTTHLAIKYAQQVLNSSLPGYVQLAGGTNQYTVTKLRSLNLLPDNFNRCDDPQKQKVSGIAYGSFARKLLNDVFLKLEQISPANQLENYPDLLWKAVNKASLLVSELKLT
jgi:Fe-S-cluster-containing hydrogenase component 2